MKSAPDKQKLLCYVSSEVDALLDAYEKYKSLAVQIASTTLTVDVPRFSFGSNLGKMQNLDPKKELRKQQERIGESMKFQNPLIWLRYKYIAYMNEPGKELKNLADLVAHCEVDGICHKRFDAINTYLRQKYSGKDMTSQMFMDQSTGLDSVAQDQRFIDMCLDQEFAGLWSSNENDRSGKWRNYILSSAGHRCETKCTC